MDAAWPRRMRWRRAGAWMWPAFIAATVADAIIGNRLPPTGDSEALVAAGLAGLVLNVIGVILLRRPLGALLRRRRPDLPRVVAADYAGTTVVTGIAALLLLAGLLHHSNVMSNRRAMQDAIKRAQAFIGDRAPDEFRRNLEYVSTFAIQPGSLYRACVPSIKTARTYCVIVDTHKPFASSVRFGGYEPNSTFSEGVN
jgi:hypothetical protein